MLGLFTAFSSNDWSIYTEIHQYSRLLGSLNCLKINLSEQQYSFYNHAFRFLEKTITDLPCQDPHKKYEKLTLPPMRKLCKIISKCKDLIHSILELIQKLPLSSSSRSLSERQLESLSRNILTHQNEYQLIFDKMKMFDQLLRFNKKCNEIMSDKKTKKCKIYPLYQEINRYPPSSSCCLSRLVDMKTRLERVIEERTTLIYQKVQQYVDEEQASIEKLGRSDLIKRISALESAKKYEIKRSAAGLPPHASSLYTRLNHLYELLAKQCQAYIRHNVERVFEHRVCDPNAMVRNLQELGVRIPINKPYDQEPRGIPPNSLQELIRYIQFIVGTGETKSNPYIAVVYESSNNQNDHYQVVFRRQLDDPIHALFQECSQENGHPFTFAIANTGEIEQFTLLAYAQDNHFPETWNDWRSLFRILDSYQDCDLPKSNPQSGIPITKLTHEFHKFLEKHELACPLNEFFLHGNNTIPPWIFPLFFSTLKTKKVLLNNKEEWKVLLKVLSSFLIEERIQWQKANPTKITPSADEFIHQIHAQLTKVAKRFVKHFYNPYTVSDLSPLLKEFDLSQSEELVSAASLIFQFEGSERSTIFYLWYDACLELCDCTIQHPHPVKNILYERFLNSIIIHNWNRKYQAMQDIPLLVQFPHYFRLLTKRAWHYTLPETNLSSSTKSKRLAYLHALFDDLISATLQCQKFEWLPGEYRWRLETLLTELSAHRMKPILLSLDVYNHTQFSLLSAVGPYILNAELKNYGHASYIEHFLKKASNNVPQTVVAVIRGSDTLEYGYNTAEARDNLRRELYKLKTKYPTVEFEVGL